MNTILITGNLTKDPVLRHTQAGKTVLGFDVANNQGYGDNQRTEYYQCSLWGDRASKLEQYLSKGMKVTVTGEHSTEKREHNGKTYFDSKVFVREIELPQKSSTTGAGDSNVSQSSTANQSPPTSSGGDFDDDIPF